MQNQFGQQLSRTQTPLFNAKTVNDVFYYIHLFYVSSLQSILSVLPFDGKLSDCFVTLVRDRNEKVRATIVAKTIEVSVFLRKIHSENVLHV